jgi:hypothetical protein
MAEKGLLFETKEIKLEKLLMSEIVCKEFHCVRQNHEILCKTLSIPFCQPHRL